MAINGLAVDVLDIFGEELGDVFVGTPVLRDAQFIAIFGFEFGFQFWLGKQVGAKPVQVGKLLGWQLVQLAIGCGGEAGANEVFQVQIGVGEVFALAGHVVGQVQNLAVAVVGSDQVRVADPAVINRLTRLHGGLQFFNHIALLDDVVLDLDASDFLKRFGQRLGFVLVHR